jgi:hypothetical protein
MFPLEWQNAYVERVIGSIRRGYLDHVIVANAAELHRVLADVEYCCAREHISRWANRRRPRVPSCRPRLGVSSRRHSHGPRELASMPRSRPAPYVVPGSSPRRSAACRFFDRWNEIACVCKLNKVG